MACMRDDRTAIHGGNTSNNRPLVSFVPLGGTRRVGILAGMGLLMGIIDHSICEELLVEE